MPRRQAQKRRGAAPVDFVAEILSGCDDGDEEGCGGGGAEYDDGPAGAAAGTPPPGEYSAEYKSKNLETERRRRARIKNQLFTLRSLVPTITKMSKEATITDAVDYIQELERQKEGLQKELQGIMADEAATELKPGGDCSTGATKAAASPVPLHCKEGVEMSTLGKNRFLAGIACRSRRGAFTGMVEAVGSLGLEVTDASFLSVDGVSQIMLCMEARGDRAVAGDKVRDLLLSVIELSRQRSDGIAR